jgi:ribonucleoside-diphosphate reductase beta chain
MAVAVDSAKFDSIDRVDINTLTEFHVDNLLEYVHDALGDLDYNYPMDLYYKYLRQRWNVADLDFTQDRIDWEEKLNAEQRETFLRVATGFHHGEREVAQNIVPLILAAPREEQKVFLSSQLEDEARHTVFFDRFYKEVVLLDSNNLQETLDKSWGYVQEEFGGAFGILSYMADQLRLRPDDRHLMAQFIAFYHLFIEGTAALAIMKVTLSFCKRANVLPAYHKGFLATCRDEARHVAFGTKMLNELIAEDPSLVADVHEIFRTTFGRQAVAQQQYQRFESIGYTFEQYNAVFIEEFARTIRQAGIKMTDEMEMMLNAFVPISSGG